ncbi:MAG: YheU family protein [Kangiella sp.]|nr:YheU family protein [Kangiella sp.]
MPAETLTAVIEEYITREGTDYGEQEYSLQDKIDQVRSQLERGVIKITFDPESETCTLMPTRENTF